RQQQLRGRRRAHRHRRGDAGERHAPGAARARHLVPHPPALPRSRRAAWRARCGRRQPARHAGDDRGLQRQLAWGFTNSYGDWMDWVRVIRDEHDPARYKVPGGWATLQTHEETIRVKGEAPRTLKVED